jgi:hypothetical protein
MENAANAHPPVDIYKVKIGDVILVDRVTQAKGPKSNWDGGKCTVKKTVKRDRNIDFITVKPFAFGARVEKVIAHPDLTVPSSAASAAASAAASGEAPTPTAAASSPKAHDAKRSSQGTTTKRAHVNGQFTDSDGSESDDSITSSSSDEDSIETHPDWPGVQSVQSAAAGGVTMTALADLKCVCVYMYVYECTSVRVCVRSACVRAEA